MFISLSVAQMGAGIRSSMVSLNSQADLDLRQVFTQVGTYKGTVVAVKRINKKYVDLTRNVCKELKLVSLGKLVSSYYQKILFYNNSEKR